MYSTGGATSWPRSFFHWSATGLPDPVDVGRDPADGDVAQEQHGGEPEQVRPEVGERPRG